MNGRFDITTGTEFGDTVVATCDTGLAPSLAYFG